VYDSGIDDEGQLFYTMEVIQGQSLREAMRSCPSFPVARAVHIIGQICEALAEAHGLHEPIVHRDIKPANIFLEEQNGEDWVKVGDFGIAKVLGEETSGLSHTGVSPGTPRYMAPEQWMGKEVDSRADLYALGVMFYEMLTGTSPFATADGAMGLMYQHLHNPPRPLPVTIPTGIRKQIEHMLAKSPQERPANATLIRRALEVALTDTEEQQTILLRGEEDAFAQTRLRQDPEEAKNSNRTPSRTQHPETFASTHTTEKSHTPVQAEQKKWQKPFQRSRILGGVALVAALSGGWWYQHGQHALPLDKNTVQPQKSQATTSTASLSAPASPQLREIDSNLITAARTGSSETVQALIDQGANVNAQDDTGQTALMAAASRGATGTVQLLLNKGASVNAKDSTGKTALLWATSGSPGRFGLIQTLTDTAQVLLTAGADATVSDAEGKTALMWAATHGYDIILRTLVTRNVPLDTQDKQGNTALFFAVSNDHIDLVRVLLKSGAAVDVQNAEGKTALMAAADSNYLDIARALLTKKVDPNLRDQDGRTALMWAVNSGSLDIVQALLAKGADPTVKTRGGRDAVIVAAQKGQAEIIPALLSKGADINATDEDGKTALMWAANEGHLPSVQMLLAKGANVNITDYEGRNALIWAAAQEYIDPDVERSLDEITQALLAKNIDIRARSGEGKTALLWAAEKGHSGIVKALLARGDDPETKDWSKKSALILASNNNHSEIVKLLASAGSKGK
jgi:ankyrin repeat protein